jgi:hypothetical protein
VKRFDFGRADDVDGICAQLAAVDWCVLVLGIDNFVEKFYIMFSSFCSFLLQC